ncbi:hypothetical protein AGMMS49921_12220 [Endomicrobiia bacterium]|nr:hypothetical protein AGMMS49921_12220 [Endomicrobiia bacterium]
MIGENPKEESRKLKHIIYKCNVMTVERFLARRGFLIVDVWDVIIKNHSTHTELDYQTAKRCKYKYPLSHIV